jgi:predicted nucleic acid-binding protein
MILYLDTSALVKRYIVEAHSKEVMELIDIADIVGSIMLTRVEMAATLSKAVRFNWVEMKEAEQAWQDFRHHWLSFTRLTIGSATIERASHIAWDYRLRGYDALHLAAGLLWQETMETPILFATFDRELWHAGQKAGLSAWPENL